MTKWPKSLPPLDPEQERINDDFMRYWHEVFSTRLGVVDRWNHRYAASHAPGLFTRALEIGAGLGGHLAWEKLTPEQEREYVAVEIRENMAEQMRLHFPKIRVLVGDIQSGLEFPNGHFDRIIAIHVLEHLADLPRALTELRRLCTSNATLNIVIPCEGSFATKVAREISAKRLYQKRYNRPYDRFIKREHLNFPEEIQEELARFFKIQQRSFFPVPLSLLWCNLFIGLTATPLP